MRFAAVVLAFAGAVMATESTSTAYSTEYFTVTSCHPTVTNCPARSTAVHSSVYPVSSSSAVSYSNTTTTVGSFVSQTYALTTSTPAACPTYSVKTISTSVTTVVPTVIYETVAIPCPTTSSSPSAGFSTPYSNGTATKPPVATVTAGASTMGNSLFVAAAAGLVAVAFA